MSIRPQQLEQARQPNRRRAEGQIAEYRESKLQGDADAVAGSRRTYTGASPVVVAENTLEDAMTSLEPLRPSERASGLDEGDIAATRHITITEAQVPAVFVQPCSRRDGQAPANYPFSLPDASGAYEEQQKVDAHHRFVAPIVKGRGVEDPGPTMRRYVKDADGALAQAQKALDSGDLVAAARLAFSAEASAEKAAKMVAAYVDQIIGSAEMTVTVLEGIKTASAITLFALSLVATGGASAAATSTVFGFEVGTSAAVTTVMAGSAIAEEVGVGIVRAADGDNVDWGEIITHAAITAIVARFAPGVGGRIAGAPFRDASHREVRQRSRRIDRHEPGPSRRLAGLRHRCRRHGQGDAGQANHVGAVRKRVAHATHGPKRAVHGVDSRCGRPNPCARLGRNLD